MVQDEEEDLHVNALITAFVANTNVEK